MGHSRQPQSTEQDREQLRELTRAAHEAAKDLRAAIQEARGLQNVLKNEMPREFQIVGAVMLKELVDESKRVLDSSRRIWNAACADITAQSQQVSTELARLAGITSPEEFGEMIVARLEEQVRKILPEMLQVVTDRRAIAEAYAETAREILVTGAPRPEQMKIRKGDHASGRMEKPARS